jgi:hypothetical protein
MELKRKIQKKFVCWTFDFPVHIQNAPMVFLHGEWALDVDLLKLQFVVVGLLAEKKGRLTGDEMLFLRQSAELTLQKFAAKFGVTHSTVINWEKSGPKPTAMSWGQEVAIRLFAAQMVEKNDKDFAALCRKILDLKDSRESSIKIRFDGKTAA